MMTPIIITGGGLFVAAGLAGMWGTFVPQSAMFGRNIWHGGTPEGTADDLIPRGADIVGAGKGRGLCAVDLTGPTTRDTAAFGPCARDPASACQSPAAQLSPSPHRS